MKIAAPPCDWSVLPFIDKRKAPIWRCRSCGHTARQKKPPDCPCKPIVIGLAGGSKAEPR